jgi:hypothetical protein
LRSPPAVQGVTMLSQLCVAQNVVEQPDRQRKGNEKKKSLDCRQWLQIAWPTAICLSRSILNRFAISIAASARVRGARTISPTNESGLLHCWHDGPRYPRNRPGGRRRPRAHYGYTSILSDNALSDEDIARMRSSDTAIVRICQRQVNRRCCSRACSQNRL